MESGAINLELDAFLEDIPTSRTYNNRVFTAFEDSVILAAWERGLNKQTDVILMSLGLS